MEGFDGMLEKRVVGRGGWKWGGVDVEKRGVSGACGRRARAGGSRTGATSGPRRGDRPCRVPGPGRPIRTWASQVASACPAQTHRGEKKSENQHRAALFGDRTKAEPADSPLVTEPTPSRLLDLDRPLGARSAVEPMRVGVLCKRARVIKEGGFGRARGRVDGEGVRGEEGAGDAVHVGEGLRVGARRERAGGGWGCGGVGEGVERVGEVGGSRGAAGGGRGCEGGERGGRDCADCRNGVRQRGEDRREEDGSVRWWSMRGTTRGHSG